MVPGQGTAMLLRQAMTGGLRAALLSSLGTCAGLLIWASASAVGLSAIFVASPLAYNALRWAGALYLAFLSIQTLI
ncbi:MAG: LysE family transporter, partial [Actinomycetes bacterium]